MYTGVGLTNTHNLKKTLPSKIYVWFLFDFCNGVKNEGPTELKNSDFTKITGGNEDLNQRAIYPRVDFVVNF